MAIEHHNEFSPKQEAWLAALESGRFKQGREALYSTEGHCCLGVACAVAGCDDEKMFGVPYCYPSVHVGIQLHNGEGQLFYKNKPVYLKDVPNIQKMPGDINNLAEMNDSGVWTFKEIAAFIRARPWLVFKNFDAPEHFE